MSTQTQEEMLQIMKRQEAAEKQKHIIAAVIFTPFLGLCVWIVAAIF